MEAILSLVQIAFVYGIYKGAKHLSSESTCSRTKAYAIALGLATCIAALSWANYGTHQEDCDPLFSGGHSVVDFIPTKQDRNQQGMLVFVVLGVASLAGTHSGLKIRGRY